MRYKPLGDLSLVTHKFTVAFNASDVNSKIVKYYMKLWKLHLNHIDDYNISFCPDKRIKHFMRLTIERKRNDSKA